MIKHKNIVVWNKQLEGTAISFKMHKGQYFNGRIKKFKYKYTHFGLLACTENLVTCSKIHWWKRKARIQKIPASTKKPILKVSHYTQSSLSEGAVIGKVRSIHEFFTDAKFSHSSQLQLAEYACATGGSRPGIIDSPNTPVPCFQNTAARNLGNSRKAKALSWETWSKTLFFHLPCKAYFTHGTKA